jgi:hypothetical protein
MTFLNVLGASFAIGIVILLVLMAYRTFDNWANRKTRQKEMLLQNHMSIEELLVSLEFILKTEMDLYEKMMANTSDVDLTNLQNSEFNSIYQSLSMQCLKAVSPQFWELIEIYMDREAVQTYITQRVYNYLADKVRE